MIPFNSIKGLAEFKGGVLDVIFRDQLDFVMRDLAGVPGNKAPRRITLELDFVPVSTDGKKLEEVSVKASIKQKTPAPTLRPVVMAVGEGNILKWNPASPKHPDQRTLDELLPDKPEEERS